ncbi:hypothetical protein E2C01_041045 [Portunus trituberculatus]|uniref:Uncharacterized protein n=1 Tax=Portunus trituberculatus TaxID=210409 RepID=A0A5B7FQD9_PORTR|nr:hypothetical protein [Portunus trituberculatus]
MFSPRTKACEPTPLRPHWVCLRASTCDRHSAPLISYLISLAEYLLIYLIVGILVLLGTYLVTVFSDVSLKPLRSLVR